MSAVLAIADARVRPMRQADVDAVLVIERDAYEFPWSEGIFRDCLRVGYCCWVLEGTAAVEAYGIMQIGAGEAHVLNLCVRPALHRHGLGRLLLAHLLEVSREHRAYEVLLEVRPTNLPARALYADMGFAEVGTRRGYYPGTQGREDALILAKRL